MECDCKKGHKNQVERYPLNSLVVTFRNLQDADGSVLPFGTIGKVTDHCEDGRAVAVFKDGAQGAHTFHFPEDCLMPVNPADNPLAAANALPDVVAALNEAAKIVTKHVDKHPEASDGQQWHCYDCAVHWQVNVALAALKGGAQ